VSLSVTSPVPVVTFTSSTSTDILLCSAPNLTYSLQTVEKAPRFPSEPSLNGQSIQDAHAGHGSVNQQ
jgi:hypothetical protein